MELRDKQTSESRTSLYREQSITMDPPQQSSFVNKIKLGVRSVTVEPVLFLYFLATILTSGALIYLSYEMTCRVNLKLNDTVCGEVSTAGIQYVVPLILEWYKKNEEVQLETSLTDVLSPGNINRLSSTTIAMIIIICFATFSDKHRIRKPFMMLTLLGQALSYVGLLLCVLFKSTWSLEYYSIMSLILPSFFGGVQALVMAVFSYVSDITTQEERTFRFGCVLAFALLASPIGTNLQGTLFLNIGYYGTFAISLILIVMAMVYGKTFLKEKPSPDVDGNLLLDFFDPKAVFVDMVNVILQKRVAYRRFLVIMTFICYLLIKGSTEAERTQTAANVDLITGNDSIEHIIGSFLAILLLTKKFKMNDYLIAIISCIIRIIVGICYAFGTHYIIVFGSIMHILSGLYLVALRSVVTKLVNPSEIAKVLSLFAVCEVLHPYIFKDMYDKFFLFTKDIYIKSFFLLTCGFLLVSLILLLGLYFLYKDDLKHSPPEEQQDVNQDGTEQCNNDIEIKNL